MKSLQVRLTSNTIKKYNSALVVDVEGVGEEVLTLPISARCTVPAISMATPVVDYNRCFLDYPYEKMVGLSNETDLPARYQLLPQDPDDASSIHFHSPCPRGVIAPKSICEVPLVISVCDREEQEAAAMFKIFGSVDPAQAVQLLCFGEGPVVHASSQEVDWGQIPVLEPAEMQLTLSNESLIPAKFRASMVSRRKSFFYRIHVGNHFCYLSL